RHALEPTLNTIAASTATEPATIYTPALHDALPISANQSVTAGPSATFTAAASGNPTPTVQWQVSTDGGLTWSAISGATSTTLTLSNVTADMNGDEYEAIFTNSAGSATTNVATLTVTAAPTITTQPTSQP